MKLVEFADVQIGAKLLIDKIPYVIRGIRGETHDGQELYITSEGLRHYGVVAYKRILAINVETITGQCWDITYNIRNTQRWLLTDDEYVDHFVRHKLTGIY